MDDTTPLAVSRPPGTLRDRAAATLRDAIVAGRFAPGERLIERQLCEFLDVSRTLVREALRQLEAEGWVNILPYRGPAVAVLTADAVRQFYDVRAALEGWAVRRFCALTTDVELAELAALVATMAQAQEARDHAAQADAVRRFYDVILKVVRNDTLTDFLREQDARLTWLRQTSLTSPERASVSVDEKRKLLAALVARDGDAARCLCEQHLANASHAIVGALEVRERQAREREAETAKPRKVGRPRKRP
ncbi:GntR family transcriptional regulator [Azospirillum himalayense]|uniref:GntR family transcriptional regulator n=1 Tax=Azospirillum himalayense TaxID=654847 RepID=A0ABW0GA26_9PROT